MAYPYRRCFASSAATPMCPSVYVSRLRRAFLLNTHPDRFRSHPSEIRRGQEKLLKAISERMQENDFTSYTTGSSLAKEHYNQWASNDSSNSVTTNYEYVLERKDGSLARHSIELGDSVEKVLESMVRALEESTATVKLPPPPPTRQNFPQDEVQDNKWDAPFPNKTRSEREAREFDRIYGIFMAASNKSNRRGVNHRFDVNSLQGRDLVGFLQMAWDADLVEQRRASRIDANVAALMARRAFHFSAIDGTGTGWSSASLAKSLLSLTALWEEHKSQFHVSSFYPLRLVMSSHEEPVTEKQLDVYGGVLHLNPAYTQLQWLETLQLVTPERLEQLRYNQDRLQMNNKEVHRALGVKFKKGHSCGAREYHYFIERLANEVGQDNQSTSSHSRALILDSVVVTVETSSACRLPKVSKEEGSIRVGAQMSTETVLSAISRFSGSARQHSEQLAFQKEQCRDAMSQAQWQLGLNRVYRAGNTVSTKQLLDSLSRLLSSESTVQDLVKQRLAGNSLGIAGSGQFCHLGDDGSLVIPWDWT